jgi:glycosyltransferase involved in cell wall biosynthesis
MISCLTVTQAKKWASLQLTIANFRQQTFCEKELVIVHDDGQSCSKKIRGYVKQHFPDLSVTIHGENSKYTLGELRNLSVEIASGDVICQWDDDDLNHPIRLQTQYESLKNNNVDICCFVDQLHWFRDKNLFFWDNWIVEKPPYHLIQGTVMACKSKVASYHHLKKGEDTDFLLDSLNKGCRYSEIRGKGYLTIYVYDGRNAWDFTHHQAISRWKRLRQSQLLANRSVLEKYLPEYNLPIDEFVFLHEKGRLVVANRL